MDYKFQDGQIHYDDDVRVLLDVGESPMPPIDFLKTVSCKFDKQNQRVAQIALNAAEETDRGHRRAADHELLFRENDTLRTLGRMSDFAVRTAFETLRPEDIIERI